MNKPECPKCQSVNVVSILFGYPSEETMEAASAGKIVLGGCCVEDGDPDWHCKDCHHEW